MKPTTVAALVAAAVATTTLAGCGREEIEYYQALLTGEPISAEPYAAGSLAIEEIIEAEAPDLVAPEPEPEPPRYFELDETGPMGEVIATGVDCVPVRWVRICR